MAANIPTLSSLYSSILSDLESQYSVQISLFGKSWLRAFAMVQAAKMKLYYLAIANVQKNIFVDTAEPEAIGGTLERFGVIKLGRRPFTTAQGSYEVTVTGTIGALIKANTTFKSNDDSLNPSKMFVLDGDHTMLTASDSITLRALEGGLDSQLSIGDNLTVTAPIANVNELAVVTSELITPLAAETIEDYRIKTIEAFQLEPQGGAASDYRIWSADAQGVKRVYPYNKFGFPNEIELFVEATLVDSSDGKGTPTATILADVESVIEFDPDITKPLNERGRRPLGVFNVDINPVTIKEVDITIGGFLGLTSSKEATILSSITSELAKVRPFVDSIDILTNKNDYLSQNTIIFMIQNALSNTFFNSITLQIDGVVVTSYQFTKGDIPNLRSINYV